MILTTETQCVPAPWPTVATCRLHLTLLWERCSPQRHVMCTKVFFFDDADFFLQDVTPSLTPSLTPPPPDTPGLQATPVGPVAAV